MLASITFPDLFDKPGALQIYYKAKRKDPLTSESLIKRKTGFEPATPTMAR